MKLTILAMSAGVCMAGLIGLSSTAEANRPLISKPNQCSKYLHSATKKAKKQSRAKRRARRNWAARALARAGYGRRKWDWAHHKHYDCAKKGKWYHCQAAGYPCDRFKEAEAG